MNPPLPGSIVLVDTNIGEHHIQECAVVDRTFAYHGQLWLVLRPWCWPLPCGDSITLRAADVQVVAAARPEVTQ